MKPIQPVTMWAIAHQGHRSTHILQSTIRRTRREAVDEYLSWWRSDHYKRNWKVHYREGTRAIRVVVYGVTDESLDQN